MNRPLRWAALAVVTVLAIGGGSAYLIQQHAAQRAGTGSTAVLPSSALAGLRAAPHLVFRSTTHDATYGMVAVVALADPGGARAVSTTPCERVYATEHRLLCLAADRLNAITYSAKVLDQDFTMVRSLPINGIASRARLSRDGRLAATTTFVSGHSYASTTFSTETIVTRVDGASYGNLERFALFHQGRQVTPRDRNVWGVTFGSDDDTFYATVAWGGQTHLARGSLKARSLTTIRADAECPSLSPDGTRVAYKKRLGRPAGEWQIATYDLRSGRETLLAEPRTVDDQLEWLDDRTVVYGLLRDDTRVAVTDVWAVPADGTGQARLLVPGAWSPAVVR